MGRIVTNVAIKNLLEPGASINCNALVDTGSGYMVLPKAWMSRLGKLNSIRTIDCETATRHLVKGEVYGPVEIKIEGFEPEYNEGLFLDMEPVDRIYDPLLGYIILEQSQAVVDMLGHRLVHVKKADLK